MCVCVNLLIFACLLVIVLATVSCIGSHCQYIAAELEELGLCSPIVWYPSCNNVCVVSVNADSSPYWPAALARCWLAITQRSDCGTSGIVWLARPSHQVTGALRDGKGRPFPFAPRAFKWDGLASQTTSGSAQTVIFTTRSWVEPSAGRWTIVSVERELRTVRALLLDVATYPLYIACGECIPGMYRVHHLGQPTIMLCQ